ncbi:hypothetical protein CLOACE_21370 [Clostridium acetireducens DSM 10703]|uniref:DUF340 domain-containing protein n=1 Tax=Clostridium acetireducens DSM 10703 TaxID=1121290 RepID=A0A1E8EVY1_9CLOT|nr:LysO family transporter [Clostridium acetireducens]OFI01412.1 hypothetical protein CLOACE_21370 [Clostridium acetireducens DSM 10703]
MWVILISLTLGIAVGKLEIIPKKYLKHNSKVQYLGVVTLLFFMGVSIGINKSIINNLDIIGFKSLVFSILTTVFSILFVYISTKIFLKGDA